MKSAKRILIMVGMAAAMFAEGKKTEPAKKSATAPKAAPSGPVSIPKDAVEVQPGLFEAKDESGKVWHYTRTPFGVRRFEPEHLKDDTAEEAARISVVSEEDGVVRFVRKTPWGTAGWSKKRDKLNAAEKMAVERTQAAGKNAKGGGSATAKPAI